MENFLQDVRFGFRTLRKNLSFTVAAVLILAIGVGATTAIFSLVNSVLLRPLPFPEPDRLVMLKNLPRRDFQAPLSFPRFQAWKNHTDIFEQLAAYYGEGDAMTGVGEPEQLQTLRVSANFLPLLGITPELGRAFTLDEDKPGANVVLLTHRFWETRFHSSSSAVGEKLKLNNEIYTVVGVLPASFRFAEDPPILLPFNLDAKNGPPGMNFLSVIGRLHGSVSLDQARSALATALPEVNTLSSRQSLGTVITPLQEFFVGDSKSLLLVLFGFVLFVLLIACANTANLLLARAAVRQREIAVRVSLGASRKRLLRQLLTESVLLALIAGAIGFVLAWWSLDVLAALLANYLPTAIAIRVDGYVLAFAFVASLFTGLLFGLIPALQTSKGDLQDQLKQSGRVAGAGVTRHRLSSALIVIEMAFSLILLAGAGLLLRSFVRLLNVDRGFNSDHVLTMQVYPAPTKYTESTDEIAYLQQIMDRVRALPGVTAAGFTISVPLTGQDINGGFSIENRPEDQNEPPQASKRFVAGDFFSVMRVPLIKGRYLNDKDTNTTVPVVVINQALAMRYFPNEDPIGKHIDVGWGKHGWSEIVGIVGNLKDVALSSASQPTYYAPVIQKPELIQHLNEFLVIRSGNDPLTLVQSIRTQVHQLDPEQAIAKVFTMDQIVDESLSTRRAPMWLFGTFSVIALLLAAIGIYGVLSYYVLQRRAEIGVRMALGAQRKDILQLIMGHALKLISVGLVVGIGLGLAVCRALSSLLFNVNFADPITFVEVSLVLGVLALVACGAPLIRAVRVDPLSVLRTE